jgi:hypothetical protein
MMHGGVRVGIGTRFAYDGEVIEVVAVAPASPRTAQCRSC